MSAIFIVSLLIFSVTSPYVIVSRLFYNKDYKWGKLLLRNIDDIEYIKSGLMGDYFKLYNWEIILDNGQDSTGLMPYFDRLLRPGIGDILYGRLRRKLVTRLTSIKDLHMKRVVQDSYMQTTVNELKSEVDQLKKLLNEVNDNYGGDFDSDTARSVAEALGKPVSVNEIITISFSLGNFELPSHLSCDDPDSYRVTVYDSDGNELECDIIPDSAY